MENAEFAIAMPGASLWGQTFMKRTNQVTGLQGGEYTYTSELNRMQRE